MCSTGLAIAKTRHKPKYQEKHTGATGKDKYIGASGGVARLALVGYSSSEDEGEAAEQSGPPCPLPVPQAILSMFSDPDTEHLDDISKHGGRVRSFRHERGNWASFVYVAFHPREEFWEMLEELEFVARKHGVVLTKMEEFHISLSPTVVLRHHWINPFVQALRDRLCSVRRFLCVAHQLKVYVNNEKTRTFLGLEVVTGQQQLQEVVSEVDKSLQEFNLETFYQNPSFHMSLFWCVGEVTNSLQGDCLLELQKVVDEFEDSDVLTRFYADEISCKCGNKVMSIPLR